MALWLCSIYLKTYIIVNVAMGFHGNLSIVLSYSRSSVILHFISMHNTRYNLLLATATKDHEKLRATQSYLKHHSFTEISDIFPRLISNVCILEQWIV